MTDDVLTCPWHDELLSKDHPCHVCCSEFAGPIPDTHQERAAEIQRLSDSILTVPFNVLHERFDRLVGRPLLSHELAYTDLLVHEVLSGVVPSIEGIMAKLPVDKPVLVVEVSDANTQ